MVQWNAGQRVTASKLSTTRLEATCDTTLTVTTVVTDVSGLSITFTTTRDNVAARATCYLDCNAIGVDPLTGLLIARLNVDGGEETANCLWNAGSNNTTADNLRSPASQGWDFTLASAGSHTVKIVANRSGGTAGDLNIEAVHSTLQLTVEDHV